MSETTTNQGMTIADNTGNPAPLGLIGFGMTTVLLNLHNIGLYPVNSAIMGMGIFVGGLAQIIAGVQEWKKNNTFGATAFTAYGAFWMSLVAIWILPKINFIALDGVSQQATVVSVANATNELGLGYYLAIWGLFTLGMFIGTFRLNRALQVVFGTLTVLFFGLACRDFLGSAGIEAGKTVGLVSGWIGIVCGLSAVYTCIAQVLNEVYAKAVLPLGPMKK